MIAFFDEYQDVGLEAVDFVLERRGVGVSPFLRGRGGHPLFDPLADQRGAMVVVGTNHDRPLTVESDQLRVDRGQTRKGFCRVDWWHQPGNGSKVRVFVTPLAEVAVIFAEMIELGPEFCTQMSLYGPTNEHCA